MTEPKLKDPFEAMNCTEEEIEAVMAILRSAALAQGLEPPTRDDMPKMQFPSESKQ